MGHEETAQCLARKGLTDQRHIDEPVGRWNPCKTYPFEKREAKWNALVDDFETKSFNVALFKRRELLNVEFDGDHESIRDYIHRVEAIRQDLTLMNDETFDNLDDYTLQQVKVKLTSREERTKQVKSVAEVRARKVSSAAASAPGSTPSGAQQSSEQNALFAQGKKTQRSNKVDVVDSKRGVARILKSGTVRSGDIFLMSAVLLTGNLRQEDRRTRANQGHMGKARPKIQMMTLQVTITQNESVCVPFVLDNAAGVHICGCRDAFESLSNDCDVKMTWFDHTEKKAGQYGIVKFIAVDAVTGERVQISVDAVFDNGAMNLLSQRLLLMKHGFRAQISEDQQSTTLTQPLKKWVWKYDMVDGLYESMVEVRRSKTAMTVLKKSPQSGSNLRLWHLRLAHANWNVIKLMAEKELVGGLELSNAERKTKARCYNCEMAKMKRM
ncbi:unnamed protein product [Phytophthora fragariaefolia]|uniref:Unnamed protein product n=1 Tax=Phytophthora fragariaefolia TaxID=1490495 RepID=A0A9W6UCZ1_9STRA|nr:unnamed protein product [Phytophthora fragariaefolia]